MMRPLIECEKNDILEYVKERKLAYCVDASNQETRFMRNRIRHRLLPDLERYYNPKIKNALANLAETVTLDFAYLDEVIQKNYPKVIRKRKEGLLILKKKKFLQQPEALRFSILQKAVKEVDSESELDYFHWDEFRKALEQDSRSYKIHVANELSLAIERKEIILKKQSEEDVQNFEYTLREGDVFQPLGLHYTKKLKDFFISRKIPSYEKSNIPLFASRGEIFWIYGVEISDRFKVTHRTRRFLI